MRLENTGGVRRNAEEPGAGRVRPEDSGGGRRNREGGCRRIEEGGEGRMRQMKDEETG